jgi:hypothetical protein
MRVRSRLAVPREEDRARALSKQLHVDCAERLWACRGQVACVRAHQQIVIRSQDFLDEYGRRSADEELGLCETACNTRQHLPSITDHGFLYRRRQIVPSVRRYRHHIGDCQLRASASRQKNGTLEGRVSCRCGIDVNQNAPERFHV